MKKTPKQQAFDIINQTYQPLEYLRCNTSSGVMWEWSKHRAKEQVKLIMEQIPMYVGNFNPLWIFWNDVLKEIHNQ